MAPGTDHGRTLLHVGRLKFAQGPGASEYLNEKLDSVGKRGRKRKRPAKQRCLQLVRSMGVAARPCVRARVASRATITAMWGIV